ncbi:hypothetical protein GCM10010431_53170 [Streptomyces kunmingensis]
MHTAADAAAVAGGDDTPLTNSEDNVVRRAKAAAEVRLDHFGDLDDFDNVNDFDNCNDFMEGAPGTAGRSGGGRLAYYGRALPEATDTPWARQWMRREFGVSW